MQLNFNGKQVNKVLFNGNDVKKIMFNGTLAWQRGLEYTTTNGTYYFAYDEATNTFSSNNQGKHSTTATTTLTFTSAYTGTVTVNWTVSSEASYDKLTIKYNSTTKVSAVSGTKNGSFEITNIAVGDKLVLQYSKDGSNNTGTDTATVSLVI